MAGMARTDLARRTLLSSFAALPLLCVLAGCAGGLGAPRSLEVGAAELERRLRERMPLRQSVGGIVDVTANLAGLRLLPDEDRLAAEMKFVSSGPLLPQPWHGSFDLLFGLRYDAGDHSLRAHQLELQSLRLPMVMGRSSQLLQQALNAVSQQLAQEVVLHRFSPDDVQRLESFGLQPQSVNVTPRGLVVGLGRVA